MNKKDQKILYKTNPLSSKQKQHNHQQYAKKQQKQICSMFKDLTLTKKPSQSKKIIKEEPVDQQLMKEYSFLNSSNNVIVFSDQQDDDNFQRLHQIFMYSQEILPEIIKKFKNDQSYNIEQILIIFQNDVQDLQNLYGLADFLEIVCHMLQYEKTLDQEVVKKSLGILMNGAENFLYYDDQGDQFMKGILQFEWNLVFTIKYILVFLQRQTKRFYFVADSKKIIIFQYFLKCFCQLDNFYPQIVDISNHLFKYQEFRAFINNYIDLIEDLPQEKKYFIQSFMANYADIKIDREKLFQKVQQLKDEEPFLKQTKQNLQRMLSNQILIEQQIINKELVDDFKKL